MQKNILVTGGARTGTTWIGETIASSPAVRYVYEPFNIRSKAANALKPPYQYFYIHDDNAAKFRERVANIYRPTDWKTRAARLVGYGTRTLQKDPAALFSSSWLASELDAKVIVMVRHPAAVVYSRLRMEWRVDFSHLLKQEALMRDHLAALEPEMRKRLSKPDLFEEAILLWKVHFHFVDACRHQHPDWLFVRHEDVCFDPVGQFTQMFEFLDLPFTRKTREIIQRSTSAEHPHEAPGKVQHCLKRESSKVPEIWKDRLSAEQIERIREQVSEISDRFYKPDEW
mgnify:CR=1 FL=1